MRGKSKTAGDLHAPAADAKTRRRGLIAVLIENLSSFGARRQDDGDGLDDFAAGYLRGFDDGWQAAAEWLRERGEVTANETSRR
jgi:hypothetical protein